MFLILHSSSERFGTIVMLKVGTHAHIHVHSHAWLDTINSNRRCFSPLPLICSHLTSTSSSPASGGSTSLRAPICFSYVIIRKGSDKEKTGKGVG